MKKLSKIFALLLAAAMVLSLLAGCGPTINIDGDPTNTPGGGGTQTQDPNGGGETADKTVHEMYASGTTLNMATGYNNVKTGIAYDASIIESFGTNGILTLSNGQNYREGDLKPTWVEAGKRLGINFVSKWRGEGSAQKEFEFWDGDGLEQVDMVAGSVSVLAEAGAAGKLVNIADYLDLMPNFKAYLDKNPIVKLSLVGDVETGAIYYSPYFDGVNDIERMPLMRTDWVEKLLNGEGEFTASSSKTVTTGIYTPYMPTSGSYAIESVNAAGTGKTTITKNYDAYGNIVEKMNAAGSINGVEAVNMLRDYIDATYGGYYTPANRADLFIGQDACWDADELVALLRCIVANPQTLNGTNTVFGLFSREDNNNQRKVDVFRFAGTLFGARGLESRQDYLYVGNDGQLHDARQEADSYVAMERMNAMAKEGLISESFLKDQEENTEKMLSNDLGFMHYDYSQTQTIYNEQGIMDSGEMYRPVMVPVARWNDGTGEQFFRFTESWRSVKTDGWAITKAGGGSDDNKLYAALALIDYAYTVEGQILMSYGPDEFIKTDASGNYVYFDFNGEKWPEIADSTYQELWTFDAPKGNYTNYARYFLGSTLSFLKSQAFEYQCTTEAGRQGAGYISTAIGLGVIKHPELGVASNQWYTIVPTSLPTDKQQNDQIATYTELSSSGVFSQSSGKSNLFVDIIINGYANAPASNAQGVADHVAGSWNGSGYLNIKNRAWNDALSYYESN